MRINRWIAGAGADAGGDGIQVFVCLPVVEEEREGKRSETAREVGGVCVASGGGANWADETAVPGRSRVSLELLVDLSPQGKAVRPSRDAAGRAQGGACPLALFCSSVKLLLVV
ncbi:hypothetical protein MRS44_000813 [Fusarium solani]|uniref:uncharacterized protein n=1 Tax=Fusarium solani TaxID=169388 RepID=UPI0032C3E9E0|nr:hypothetical protein MRS44_000813 [Fusarium solani]